MSIKLCIFFFILFIANVVVGSLIHSPFMGDIAEMLMLFISALFFVATVLQKESEQNIIDS